MIDQFFVYRWFWLIVVTGISSFHRSGRGYRLKAVSLDWDQARISCELIPVGYRVKQPSARIRKKDVGDRTGETAQRFISVYLYGSLTANDQTTYARRWTAETAVSITRYTILHTFSARFAAELRCERSDVETEKPADNEGAKGARRRSTGKKRRKIPLTEDANGCTRTHYSYSTHIPPQPINPFLRWISTTVPEIL